MLSETTTPSKPNSPRSTSPRMMGESVAGRSGSSAVKTNMRGHDDFSAGFDALGEGVQINAKEFFARAIDRRQAAVAVHLCIAVPGEVLERGDRAIRLQTTYRRAGHSGDQPGIFTEGAHFDDRIVGIGVAIAGRDPALCSNRPTTSLWRSRCTSRKPSLHRLSRRWPYCPVPWRFRRS